MKNDLVPEQDSKQKGQNSWFLELIKTLALAIVVGLVVGAIDALFGRVLIAISDFRTVHYLALVPFLPLAGLLIVWMYHHFSEESLKGMTLIMETRQNKRDSIPIALVPLVMLGTWITHLFGGSAGREGVAVQIGATLSHHLGRKLNMKDNAHVMLITGMAAGFGGLFQTPLAATFFAMEVIVAGVMDYEALLPALLASYISSFTANFLGLGKFEVDITDALSLTDLRAIIGLIVLGLAFGLTGKLFSWLLSKRKRAAAKVLADPYRRIFLFSLPLTIMLLLLWGGRYCGLGTNLISESFQSNGQIFPFDWILKLALTILTLSIGFQGGEVTPLFAIGASLGFVLGNLIGLPPALCAALGYAAVFGSATNTLIAPILIGLEVFGPANMAPFVIVCAISYCINGDSSIYGAQMKAGDYLRIDQ